MIHKILTLKHNVIDVTNCPCPDLQQLFSANPFLFLRLPEAKAVLQTLGAAIQGLGEVGHDMAQTQNDTQNGVHLVLLVHRQYQLCNKQQQLLTNKLLQLSNTTK